MNKKQIEAKEILCFNCEKDITNCFRLETVGFYFCSSECYKKYFSKTVSKYP